VGTSSATDVGSSGKGEIIGVKWSGSKLLEGETGNAVKIVKINHLLEGCLNLLGSLF